MSKTETIEEKTYRLLQIANKNDEGVAIDSDFEGEMFNSLLDNTIFKLHCKMIELAIAEEREANGWISVEDRLPENGKPVVLYRPLASLTQDPNICIGWNTGKTRESPQGVNHNFNCVCHVSYWLDLPAAPKDEVSE